MSIARAFLPFALFLSAASACTTYRILRYREPDARNMGMFPVRPVHRADTPIPFVRAATLRTDLDTLTVRLPGGARTSFAQYMTSQRVLAFLVIRNDTVVYETYRDGYTAETVHNSFSVAKSVLSALVGIAVGEGAIKSLDQPVTDYIPELSSKPAFAGVTIRHLLAMKSGLRFTETGHGMWSDFRSDDAHVYYTTNLYDFIAHTPRDTVPGAIWKYKDTDAELLGWVLARATGKSVAQYTEEKLWRRIGAEHDASWSLDSDGGHEKVSSGFNATARDYARIGRLYLNGGVVKMAAAGAGASVDDVGGNGVAVVPADWVRASTAVDTMRTEPEISTWWKMQHTLYWWHAIQAPAGDFFADGSHGQRIYVDPASRTIIVQLANLSSQDFPFRRIVAFLDGKSWEYPRSIPATVRRVALSAGVTVDSVRSTYERMAADERVHPALFVNTEHAWHDVATEIVAKATPSIGVEVSRIVAERYPRSVAGWVQLSDAWQKAGDRAQAITAIQRAMALAPGNDVVTRRAKALGLP